VLSDQDLVGQVGRGDKNAFSLLVDRYLKDVIYFSLRYINQRADAEDIAQETFIRLWSKAPGWQDQGYTLKAWLFRVAYNLCIDELRKQKHLVNAETDEQAINSLGYSDDLVADQDNLTIQATMLNNLPERQRTALTLCAYQGLSNKEAAAVMNVSVDALESLLSRGRRKLKKLFYQATETTGEAL